MVASAVFITDLQGKAIISRNYRGDVPLTKAIDQFQNYLVEVGEEAKKPVFHIDNNGEISSGEDVGSNGVGGEHFVYVAVSTCATWIPLLCRSTLGSFGNAKHCKSSHKICFSVPSLPRCSRFSTTASKCLLMCCNNQEFKCCIDFDFLVPTWPSVQRLFWLPRRRVDKG
eukprot:scaffold3791_cov137-Cylindrotheca_fusiformis.AAC.16